MSWAPAPAEPVIETAEIVAGHDGSAELVVRIRHPNGVLGSVTLDADTGLELMNKCGASKLDDLAGQSWRKIL